MPHSAWSNPTTPLAREISPALFAQMPDQREVIQ
jgi:hypothetical protein